MRVSDEQRFDDSFFFKVIIFFFFFYFFVFFVFFFLFSVVVVIVSRCYVDAEIFLHGYGSVQNLILGVEEIVLRVAPDDAHRFLSFARVVFVFFFSSNSTTIITTIITPTNTFSTST